MNYFKKSSTKVSMQALGAFLLTACDGSRPRRMYETGKSLYDDYERTGDATGLIIFIVALVLGGGIWAWKKIKDNR